MVGRFPSVFDRPTTISPSIIREILFWGIMITAFIQSVTLTYIISNILISLSIYISGKHILTTTLRTSISTPDTSIFFKCISIIFHTDICGGRSVENTRKSTNQPTNQPLRHSVWRKSVIFVIANRQQPKTNSLFFLFSQKIPIFVPLTTNYYE